MKTQAAIDMAIDNIIKEGITDVEIFGRPFELSMIKENFRDQVIQAVKQSLKHNNIKSLRVSPIGQVLFPKKELFDFRKCAHIQPLDEIKYLSLVLVLADKIEQMRINKSKNVVFSYRLFPSKGYLFDTSYNFTSFREHVSKCSKKKSVNIVVSCDIANFYDRLNIHRLECILASSDKTDKKIISQINELLLFWSNRDSYGIPVGSNASRILAEAALIEVDNYLQSKKISFCRFVDDYRIFAKDSATAHHWLSLLVDKLSKEGLFINTSKTEIKDVSGYAETQGEVEVNENVLSLKEVSKATEDKLNLPIIIRGYSGLIPTKFRKLTEAEVLKLEKNDAAEMFSEISVSVVIEPKKFVALTKTCVAQEIPDILVKQCSVLNKFPQFIPYTLDVISKQEGIFSESQILEITELLNGWLIEGNASEYILVYIVRFFGTGRFSNKAVLFEYYRSLRRNEGSYIGRSVLEKLEPLVARGEVLEIRDYYSRADLWEKRQIAKMVDIHLTEGEKRPFFKNILSIEEDLFLNSMSGSFSK